jgi:phage/conjugal plasmid C-4 type zinc finger TraR family protein
VEEVNSYGGNMALDRADEIAARQRDAGIARAAASVKAEGREACMDCGRPIPKQRRLAAPFARRCVDCQEEMERGA